MVLSIPEVLRRGRTALTSSCSPAGAAPRSCPVRLSACVCVATQPLAPVDPAEAAAVKPQSASAAAATTTSGVLDMAALSPVSAKTNPVQRQADPRLGPEPFDRIADGYAERPADSAARLAGTKSLQCGHLKPR